jgi:hypothetical protein
MEKVVIMERFLEKAQRKIENVIEGRKCQLITRDHQIGDYKRICHIHNRKTSGTSLNHAFLNLSGTDSQRLYGNLAKKLDHRLIYGNKVYVGWNEKYINHGSYFYGFSHVPLHTLKLPEKTFTVTCFRDPVNCVTCHI